MQVQQVSTDRFDVGSAWPEVAPRVARVLHARRAPADSVDDLVQEVAARALATVESFANPEHLFRWSATVARNLHTDLIREARRYADGSALPDLPSNGDIESEVINRLRLSDVLQAIGALPTLDRETICDSVAGRAPAPSDAGKVAVRLCRARRRLLHLLDGTLVVLGWCRLRPRTRGLAAGSVVGVVAVVPLALGAIYGLVPEAPAVTPLRPPPAMAAIDGYAENMRRTSSTTRVLPATGAMPSRTRASSVAPANRPVNRTEAAVPGTGTKVFVESRDSEPEDHLICLQRMPVIGTNCVL